MFKQIFLSYWPEFLAEQEHRDCIDNIFHVSLLCATDPSTYWVIQEVALETLTHSILMLLNDSEACESSHSIFLLKHPSIKC